MVGPLLGEQRVELCAECVGDVASRDHHGQVHWAVATVVVPNAAGSWRSSPQLKPEGGGTETVGVPARRFRIQPSAVTSVVRAVTEHPANRHRRAGALAHLIVCEIRARATGAPVVTVLGSHSRIRAHLHRGGSWRVVRANPPDWPEMTAWRKHLRPGDLFVDVGAHAGVYTIWALDAGAEVIAVEPHPELVAQLRDNLALNGYRADVVEAALGAASGTMRLSGPDLLRGHLVLGDDPESSGFDVRVDTLDALLAERVVAGVKVDVEGAERLVLQGAQHALAAHRIRLLQLEWNDCSTALLGEDRGSVAALLRDFGYELARPDERGVLVPVTDIAFGPDMFARPID
jgi:FkbM family methyltransferase